MRVAGVLAVGLLGLVGWQLGVAATRSPTLELGDSFSDGVELWATPTSAPVSFTWSLRPSGGVEMYLSIEERDRGRTSRYTILLRCDARLDSFDERSDHVSTRTVGDDARCGLDSSEATTQIIDVPVDDSGIAVVSGDPHVPWTSTAGGRRVARTPSMGIGTRSREIPGVDTNQLVPPRWTRISAELWGTASESLDSYLPTELTVNGRVQAFAEEQHLGGDREPTGSAAGWSRSFDPSLGTDQQPTGLITGTARWSDPQGVADAQRALLLSGVLLGVVASLAVEGAFALVRSRRSASSGDSMERT